MDTYEGTPAAPVNYSACLTATQIQAELQSFLASKGLPEDVGHQYALFFPPGVQTFEAGDYSGVDYVGIHQSFNPPGKGVIYYDDEPYQDNWYDGGAPNGDGTADTAIDVLSHELNESITDPSGKGWWDSSGNEIGDECSDDYGPPLGTVVRNGYLEPYNQVINGDKYYIQREFRNAAYAALGVGHGCVQVPYAASVSASVAKRHVAKFHNAFLPDDAADTPTTVTLDASPSDLPADGTSTSTITLTALDASGDPVSGAPMHLFVQSDYDTAGAGDHTVGGGSGTSSGACGTLSGDDTVGHDGTTNADGQLQVTYTASANVAECYVLATNIDEGTTTQTVIYQGTDSSDAPSVKQTLPGSLEAGGPMATFTAMANNPSSRDIADARFDIYITGDDSGDTGLDAGQLTLSYKDPATNGDFVNVPLTGTTANGGEIDGFIVPDTAEKLDANGGQRTATFELTLADGAPDTAATGAPLEIETDLDSFDPADGSQSNLDVAGPDPLPVVPVPGDTVTFSGKFDTSVAPSANSDGSGTLDAKTCSFASDGAKCRFTGTAVLTLTGGTLTGFISTDDADGVADRTVSFTESFTDTSPTAASGTGTAEVTYFDDGNTASENLTASDTTAPTKTANVQTEQGTITLTNAAP